MMGSKVKVIDGSNCWKMKRCWKKEVDNRVIVGNTLLLLEVWSLSWREKTFVMWLLVWMNKKKWLFSFKIHQIQKWYSSISHCELDWIELKKKFIPFQMTCIYHIMVKMCYYFIHNKNERQWKMVEKKMNLFTLETTEKRENLKNKEI